MEKVKGVPLSQTWDTLKLTQKLQLLLALTILQKKWMSVSFSHYGSLYYTGDVQTPVGNHYVKDGKVVKDSNFTIGPATGRDWIDAGRSNLDTERGPQKKLTALAWYRQIIDVLIPKATTITSPYLWHNDLHLDNIFIDPHNPEEITGIIDWQSCHISPLFNHNLDPAFLDCDGLEPETLDLAPMPKLSTLSPEERSAAVHEYTIQNVFIGWRKLMHAKNPSLYHVVEFRKTPAYGLIFLAHRMFEYGEAHFQSLIVDLKDTWADLPGVTNQTPFPFSFSEADIEHIKLNSDGAVAGTELVAAVKERLGDLWPDKGFIEHDRYDDCKAALHEVRDQILEQLAEINEEKDECKQCWPFE
ncbi:hypothetical protein N0V94_003662 [Neodidymelliopsis sp. IMI 364377]|nr:hypothetical protein N0V94_003662 [Neodidymelliopsis sp. IMI 364377]